MVERTTHIRVVEGSIPSLSTKIHMLRLTNWIRQWSSKPSPLRYGGSSPSRSAIIYKRLIMKVKTLIEWLQELPEDYDLNLSEYHYIEDKEDDKEHFVVRLDKPIGGLVKHDEHREICFLLTGEDVARENGDHVTEIEKI